MLHQGLDYQRTRNNQRESEKERKKRRYNKSLTYLEAKDKKSLRFFSCLKFTNSFETPDMFKALFVCLLHYIIFVRSAYVKHGRQTSTDSDRKREKKTPANISIRFNTMTILRTIDWFSGCVFFFWLWRWKIRICIVSRAREWDTNGFRWQPQYCVQFMAMSLSNWTNMLKTAWNFFFYFIARRENVAIIVNCNIFTTWQKIVKMPNWELSNISFKRIIRECHFIKHEERAKKDV